MIYRYNKGFKVDELKTNVSKSFLYYVQGSATNEETGDIHVFFSGKIRKHEGINYIYSLLFIANVIVDVQVMLTCVSP